MQRRIARGIAAIQGTGAVPVPGSELVCANESDRRCATLAAQLPAAATSGYARPVRDASVIRFAVLTIGCLIGCRADRTTPPDAQPPEAAASLPASPASPPSPPPEASALHPVAEVSVGSQSACFRTPDGEVSCAGWVYERMIPDAGPEAWSAPRPVGVHDAIALDVGWGVACAVRRDHSLACWGWYSRYVPGADADRMVRQVDGVSDAANVVLGLNHVCVLRIDATVECFGGNMHGEIGVEPGTEHPARVRIEGLSRVAELAAGSFHTCARLDGGSVRCFGTNLYGQLGTGDQNTSLRPVAVVGIGKATQVAANRFHSCARLADATVWCWGEQVQGEFGVTAQAPRAGAPGLETKVLRPVEVTGLRGAASIALGADFVCGRMADGTVRCGGSDSLHQLGRGGFARGSAAFEPVSGVDNAEEITAHEYQACARIRDGTVRCWGYNNYGALGVGAKDTVRTAKVVVATER
jgi:hypothetical protein